jgi:hypothetical protein
MGLVTLHSGAAPLSHEFSGGQRAHLRPRLGRWTRSADRGRGGIGAGRFGAGAILALLEISNACI